MMYENILCKYGTLFTYNSVQCVSHNRAYIAIVFQYVISNGLCRQGQIQPSSHYLLERKRLEGGRKLWRQNCEIHNRKDQSSTDKALTPEGKTKSRENHVRTDQASMQNCESQNSEDNLCIDKTSTPDCGSQVGKINLSMRGILMPSMWKTSWWRSWNLLPYL